MIRDSHERVGTDVENHRDVSPTVTALGVHGACTNMGRLRTAGALFELGALVYNLASLGRTGRFEPRAFLAGVGAEVGYQYLRRSVDPPRWRSPRYLLVLGLYLTAVSAFVNALFARDDEDETNAKSFVVGATVISLGAFLAERWSEAET